MKKIIMRVVTLALILLAVVEGVYAFTHQPAHTNKELAGKKSINLAYILWDSEIASTTVIKQVLEEQGYQVTMTQLDVAIMFEAVAKGEADALVGAWLPSTHADYYQALKGQFDDLGPNLEGAKIGLVVPAYMTVDSIDQLTNEANQTITGVEPGAGMMFKAEEVLNHYKNLQDWKLSASSTGAMVSQLQQAYAAGEDIIVTGWTPHWMFKAMDLKFLNDPDNLYGESESVHTLARLNLKEDSPLAYDILDRFYWEVEDMESVMLDMSQGVSSEQAAKNWIDANRSTVDQWIP